MTLHLSMACSRPAISRRFRVRFHPPRCRKPMHAQADRQGHAEDTVNLLAQLPQRFGPQVIKPYSRENQSDKARFHHETAATIGLQLPAITNVLAAEIPEEDALQGEETAMKDHEAMQPFRFCHALIRDNVKIKQNN